jgi:hypothetical protein
MAKGKRSIRKDLRKKLEDIHALRCDTKVQRYIKIIPIVDSLNGLEIAETDLYTILPA